MIPEKIRANLAFVVQFFVARSAGITLGLFMLCSALGLLAYALTDSSIFVPEMTPKSQAFSSWITPIVKPFIGVLVVGALFFLAVSTIFIAVAVSGNSPNGMMRKVGVPKSLASKILQDKKTAEEVSAAWNERNPNLRVTSFKQRFTKASFSELAQCRREYRELHNMGRVTPESVSLMLIGFDLEDIITYDNKVMLSAWLRNGDIRRSVAIGRAEDYDIDQETFGSFLNGDKLSMRSIA